MVLKLNINKIKPTIIAKFKKDYVNSQEWDLEKLKKASKAMGPLGEWLESLTFLANQQEKNEKLKTSKEMKSLIKLES